MESEMKFKFDKFIKDIVKREETGAERLEEYLTDNDETPQRRYNRLYRERWQNRIKFKREVPGKK
tara:strand:- start:116 stop:310 length:195 start_codon:yes stop_codon:yes gene_type:complete